MNHTATDVIIHTHNPLSQTQFEEVANQVKRIEGVIRFDRSPAQPVSSWWYITPARHAPSPF